MSKKYVISDTHFRHQVLLTDPYFNRKFLNIDEHDDYIVNVWNSIVNPEDTVFHLGDVVVGAGKDADAVFDIIGRLNGTKIWILGNHDTPYKIERCRQYFKSVNGYWILNVNGQQVLMSHMPVHPCKLARYDINVHGDLHHNTVDDTRYINVCVEHTKMAPVLLDDIIPQKLPPKPPEMVIHSEQAFFGWDMLIVVLCSIVLAILIVLVINLWK